VAIGGPGFTIAQGAAEKAILRNANYDHLADQIDPLDPVNLAASTLVAGTFGAVHVAGAKRAAGKAEAAPTSPAAQPAAAPSAPLAQMTPEARKALPFNSAALDQYATEAAQRAGVPPEMLLFIKNRGERSNSNQVSPKDAKGVMQFIPDTWKAYGKGDPTDPVNSIDAAAAYAADLLKRYNGDMRAAITEYNGGIKQAREVQAGLSPTDPETIAYLKRFDEYAANHQIDNLTFAPTPEQVDASLLAHGQRLVDDAHIGPADDVASMVAHQDAFELAARQMDNGEPVDVTSAVPPELMRGDVLERYGREIGAARAAEEPVRPATVPANAAATDAAALRVEQPTETVTQTQAPEAAAPQAPGTNPEATPPSPVEQNVRAAALERPDAVVHLDANAGPHEGKIADVLKVIDDEHQATLQDAGLLEVAANCFISTGS
jgi:soluble lytic murein transglycosylase-like protein